MATTSRFVGLPGPEGRGRGGSHPRRRQVSRPQSWVGSMKSPDTKGSGVYTILHPYPTPKTGSVRHHPSPETPRETPDPVEGGPTLGRTGRLRRLPLPLTADGACVPPHDIRETCITRQLGRELSAPRDPTTSLSPDLRTGRSVSPFPTVVLSSGLTGRDLNTGSYLCPYHI